MNLATLAHPAHALLSVAHALLGPANTIANITRQQDTLLPIEQVPMPTENVSDLRDVVDAINKLCETMKTEYEYEDCEEIQDGSVSVHANNIVAENITNEPEKCHDVAQIMTEAETLVAAERSETVAELLGSKTVTLDDIHIKQVTAVPESDTKVGTQNVETCSTVIGINSYIISDVLVSKPVTVEPDPHKLPQSVTEKPLKNDDLVHVVTDSESITVESITAKDKWGAKYADKAILLVPKIESDNKDIDLTVSDSGAELLCEPTSEMYYTASSEVSLLSDIDLQDKAQNEDSDKERDDRNSVIAGHVAAMRERFESMTRTNTPCPDLIRSASPSFEVFRNFNTSPDRLE